MIKIYLYIFLHFLFVWNSKSILKKNILNKCYWDYCAKDKVEVEFEVKFEVEVEIKVKSEIIKAQDFNK